MTSEPATPPPATTPPPASAPPAPARDTADQLHDRMEAFGREAQAAGERFGREAQAAGERLSRDPGVITMGVWIGRMWGLVLMAVGLWFFAQVTLGMDLPTFDWNLIWPLALIVLGGTVLISGLARRR